jgi:hypothetical protein
VGRPQAGELEDRFDACALIVPDSVDLGRLFEPFEGQASNP